ncbi:hypothetical protein Tco_1353253 [Tanacetum coccineum]
MSKSFEALQKHVINLELDLQQCKEKIKNDKSFKENQSNIFLKECEQYFEIQDLKAQLQDKGIAISEFKKLIEKMKGKYLVEIILFIVDSGCSKHMTGNLKLLTNFVEKFMGTVMFGNDQIAPILGYGDLVQGTITIKWVYYIEGLNHNLFSVGQFCSRGTYLYKITLQDSTTPNPICLMAKATSSQAWLWHQSINGKKYVLVIVDEDTIYRDLLIDAKDETPGFLIDFLTLDPKRTSSQVKNSSN